jgi:nicotinate-nucleotide pyrophosphorylase (carboxylating)
VAARGGARTGGGGAVSFRPAVDEALSAAGLGSADTERAVRGALAEDMRYGPDVTTEATVPAGRYATAAVVARQPGVLAGVPVALAVLDAAGAGRAERVAASGAGRAEWVAAGAGSDRAGRDRAGAGAGWVKVLRRDGDRIGPGEELVRIHASARELLRAERTMLNFLTHLSGIATATRAWADAVAGTGCTVRDTRKTLPGLRQLEKYAVRCGGGANHRLGLGDAALIKDNHVAAAGGTAPAITAVRAAAHAVPLEVECDTLAQVHEALAAGASLILLDNMDLAAIRAAVALRVRYPRARFEASGGLRLDNAQAVAATGVDYLAVGALTHSSPALDLGLDLLDGGGSHT